MGFNSVLHLRNCDLDAIAADPNFGAAVDSVISRADTVLYMERRKGVNTRTAISLSELSDHRNTPYEIQ